MIQHILIFLGLSIDGFIVMMNKGAQLRNLSGKKIFLYALEFAVVATGMFMLGYLVSEPFVMSIERARIEIMIAALIVFFIGTLSIVKSKMNKGFEERLDDAFDWKTLLRKALYTSVDTFFIGAAYGFLSVTAMNAAVISFAITFLTVLSALIIGYNLGAKYQRIAGMIGGALLVFFGIFLITVYVVMR